MDYIAQLTKAFRHDTPEKALKILSQMVKKSDKKLELEFFTGKTVSEWLEKLSSSITTGEFLMLLRFFQITVSIDPEGMLADRCLLEKIYLETKELLNIRVEFDTLHWIDLEPTFTAHSISSDTDDVMGLYSELRKIIVGQDEQLKRILFFISTNLNIIKHNSTALIPIPKRNMLVTGGTGTGKTFTIQRLAQILEIPLVEFDVSHLTQSGYVGMDISDIVEALSENNPNFPQILFLDEFDKLCVLNGDKSNVGTYGGQRSLLKILEANLMRADGYSKDKRKFEDYNMSNVIIILGGAFSAFSEQQELENKASIGFGVGDKTIKKDLMVTEKELIAAGIMPEIAGRIGQVVKMNTLTDEALREVLLTSKESILKQFKVLAYYDNREFDLTEDEINDIIKSTKELKLGVRGLSTLTEKKYIQQRLK